MRVWVSGSSILLSLVILAAPGCSFQRTVRNDGVRDLDPSFIEVGKTTWLEVFQELGPPTGLPSLRYLKYTATDRRTSLFRLRLLFLVLPFRWSDQQRVEELLVEFDSGGVVSGVYKSWMNTVRPPLQGEESRLPYIISAIEDGRR